MVHLPTFKPWNRCPYYDFFSTLTYSYHPQPLPVSVHLLTSADNAKTLSGVWKHYARKGLTIETMLQGHYDFIAPEHQQEIAAAVKRLLDRYDNTNR